MNKWCWPSILNEHGWTIWQWHEYKHRILHQRTGRHRRQYRRHVNWREHVELVNNIWNLCRCQFSWQIRDLDPCCIQFYVERTGNRITCRHYGTIIFPINSICHSIHRAYCKIYNATGADSDSNLTNSHGTHRQTKLERHAYGNSQTNTVWPRDNQQPQLQRGLKRDMR
jgi:hypothetical protein